MRTKLLNRLGTSWAAVFLISILIGIATLLLYSSDLKKSKIALISNAHSQSENLKLFVANEYSGALQDIHFFSKNPAYAQFLEEPSHPYISRVLEKTSSAFLQIRQIYSQFSLLDSLGKEQLTLNIYPNQKAIRDSTASDKSYDYYSQIKNLKKNEVFISPVSAFLEDSSPIPIVEFVMPVFDSQNQLRLGFVRFHYSAKRILDRMDLLEVKDSIRYSIMDQDHNFVFHFNNSFQIYEADSAALVSKFSGQNYTVFEERNDLYFLEPMDPVENIDVPKDQLIKTQSRYSILVHYTEAYLAEINQELIFDVLLLALIRIFVSSSVLLYFLRLLKQKNNLLDKKSKALEKRNKDLEKSREKMEVNIQRIRDFAFEKNKALSNLRQKEKDLKQAQEIAQLGYYERDLVAGKSYWSDNLPSIFGLPSNYDFNAQSVENIMLKEEFEEVEKAFDQAVEEVKEYKVVYRVYHKNGKVEYLQDIAMPVVKNGEVVSMKGTIQNLTERVSVEKELLDAKIKAEAAVKAKSDFLATMSHEIRTPLNAVIGMSTLLNETQLDQKQQDFVKTIRVSGNALLGVINDILDFSKIESGEMKLENQPINLNKLVEECLQVLSVSAAQKHIKLYYKIDKNAPTTISGDEGRIRQSIINLLNNAVKFTNKGEVRVSIDAKKTSKETCQIKISICDTGIGIEKEKQETIFSAFQQADSSITRKFGGTGLGLAITQKLIQLMGGQLKVKSEIDQGSEFYFFLDVMAKWEVNERPLKIDSITIISEKGKEAETAKEILSEKGVEVKLLHYRTSNFDELVGKEIIMFCEEENKEEFIQLGEGLSASKNRIYFVCDIKKDMAECESFQITNRPLKMSWLDQLLYEKEEGLDGLMAHSVEEELKKDLQILVAEDNPINQKLIRLLFENLGYQIDLAEDGVMAVKASQNKKYDLIFMDIQMPQMGGVEATQYIKNDHGDNSPFIIALTANALDGDREKYLKEGLDDYLSKPINLQELKSKILHWQKTKFPMT